MAGTPDRPRTRPAWDEIIESMTEEDRGIDPVEKSIESPELWAEADEYGTTPNEQRPDEPPDRRLPDEPDLVPDSERSVTLPDEFDYPPD